MKLALGAPVAGRAWILPEWRRLIQAQTLVPDAYCFVLSDTHDGTLEILNEDWGATVDILSTSLPFFSREQRSADRKDPWRAAHMSNLRNKLKTLFMRTDADAFVSLDTDILLHDPTALEQLVQTLQEGWDVACGLTHLHAIPGTWCPNAGYFADAKHGEFDQAWCRAQQSDLNYKNLTKIEIPMAFYAIKRFAMSMCHYQAHESGEDVGFGQSLRKHGFGVAWRTDVVGEHVWGPEFWQRETS